MAGIADVGRLVATLGLNTSPFMAGANGAMNTMRAMQVQMMMVGRTMTRFVSLPMALAGGGAVKMQKDFESSMVKIVSLVGVARDEVNEWKKDIFNIARETARGPNELAEALYFVTSAGFRGAEAIDILRKSAMAAAGGLGETKDVADLVTSAMYAYRDSNLSAEQAMDAVIAAVREGKVEVTDLINSMGKVFPVASAFGVSIHEVGASFAAMTRSGTEADKASTHLRAILNQMMSPSEQVKKAMGGLAMGADEFQRILREDGLIVAMQELNTAIKGDPKAYADIFQNIRALTGVLDIMGDNMEENVRIFERMKNANGELKKLFEEVQNTTQFGLDKALANLGITAIELGEILKDPVISTLEWLEEKLQGVSEWLGNMTEEEKKAAMALAGYVAVAGPALVILSRLGMILAAMAGNFAGLAVLTAAMAGGAITYYTARKRANEAGEDANRVHKHTAQYVQWEMNKLNALYEVASDEVETRTDRKKAVEELIRLYPSYFGHIDTEKEKIEGLAEAYADAAKGIRLESKMKGVGVEMDVVQGTIDEYEARIKRLQDDQEGFWDDLHRHQRRFYRQGVKEHNKEMGDTLTVYEYIAHMLQSGLGRYKTQLEELTKTHAEYAEEWANYQELLKQPRTTIPPEPKPKPHPATGGYLYELQKSITDEQNRALGVSEAQLPASLAIIRAKEKELAATQFMVRETGHMSSLQQKIALAQFLQADASEAMWNWLQKRIDGWTDLEDKQRMAADGWGAIEAVAWDIGQAEKDLLNAQESEIENIKETLRLLYQKEDILKQMSDPYQEQLLLADKGTEKWRIHYEKRLEDLNNWLKTNELTENQIRSFEQERYDIQKMFDQHRIDQATLWISTISQGMNHISGLIQHNMQQELKNAGKNQRERERINLAYQKKMRDWALAQAVIQTALNVLKSWPKVWEMAAAGALGAVQIATIAAQTFAKGGMVYGPTLATVGEYPGASSNPEVIAPLSKLKSMLKSEGELPEVIELVARGEDMYATIRLQELLRNTY
jgi:TP901 family phage tail tape measure protein